MKIFSRIIFLALLITTPTAALPINGPWKPLFEELERPPIQIPDLRTLSYDEVVDLLSRIESELFYESYSLHELDQINQFISFLAMEGSVGSEKVEMKNAIASLFRSDTTHYASLDSNVEYTAIPAIYVEGAQDVVLCKNWFKKQWSQTKSFVKKHKKAIIIGTIVVVTVAVVVVAAVAISSAAASAAVATGGALASGDPSTASPGSSSTKNDRYSASSNESFASSLEDQVSTFKETVAQEQFAAVSPSSGISLEDNGRIVGSLFAHKTVDSIANDFAHNPSLANELRDLGFHSEYPIPPWLQTHPDSSVMMLHPSTDLAFSTDYTTSYGGNFGDVNAMTYQERGNLALNSECYTQAVQDFGRAISLEPTNPTLYLERGIANFELGNYEQSIADYKQFVENKAEPFSVTEFSLGFAKGVPKGAYESGKGALLFLSDFVIHPVQTSKQVVDSLNTLATLIKNDEFGIVAEALSPELHQLVTQWDTLPSEMRGELAGYAVGKLGADLLAPGAIAKVASRSLNSAKELVAVCKNLQIAQETLILETASGIGIPAKVGEIVEMGKKTAAFGEELGFTAQEIGQLQKAGKLESTVNNACEHLTKPMKESFELYQRAQNFLEQYKGFIPESQARELIHQAGVRTFPRPQGIPDNFRVQISEKGAGMIYIHPKHTHTSIRIMPGKPHSPFPYQQRPYVIHMKDGKALDKFGNKLNNKEVPEAHIPYEEFVYRD